MVPGIRMPALLTMPSSLPKVSTVKLIRSLTCCSSVTSTTRPIRRSSSTFSCGQVLGRVDGGDHLGAFVVQVQCGRQADSAAGAGDDDGLSCEQGAHGCALFLQGVG